MTGTSYTNLLSTSPFHKVAHKLPSYSLPLQALCLRRSTRPFSNKTSAVPKAAIATEYYSYFLAFLVLLLCTHLRVKWVFVSRLGEFRFLMREGVFLAGVKFFRLFSIPALNPRLFLMAPQGFASSTSKSLTLPFPQFCTYIHGLQEKIKLVPIDLEDRPPWYKEKVYPPNKVPSLEHDNEVRGESLDLMKYIDSSFEGPALYPNDPAMREFAEELLSYSDTFNRAVLFSLKGESLNEISSAVNYLEMALSKFSDGPFFLGQFSLVDIAYAPFVERFHPLLLEVKNYDITTGRPMLRSWIENMNKIEAYKQTKRDPQELVAVLKKRFSVTLPPC
ncbi:hypothetical protein RHGRI_036459 [Rhododendron griersonianum]|uniref:GST N-terminal domain-containing protein n=1 Tax=Rhododendron griersonianum TaxID=479676 RepID=A0AAV6HRX0_9ERIC|nr:hypothetical protein RHGRI_036459 [Rhododendron griersonianum]